jgi:Uma2 family endonuclease
MVMIILGREEQRELIRSRKARGLDRFDEVWDGVYVVSPIADNEHQKVAGKIYGALDQGLSQIPGAQVFPPINVSDRLEKWKKNYRCPDVSVFLPGNPAKDMGTFWYGGPDFAVEVVSLFDRSRKKLQFYAKVGVKELLLVDRKPWSLELYRVIDGILTLVGKVTPDPLQRLRSEVLPVSFRLLPGDPRPTIEVTQADDGRSWIA